MSEVVRLGGADRVAEKIGLSEPTVWRMERAGALPPAIKIGGRTLWRLDLIEDWIEEQTHAQAKKPPKRRKVPLTGGRRKVAVAGGA
jgi:predicted DNA-binding transcriptional regulator AlpA